MTTDHAFKKAVRAFAAERGIPYSQARRDYPAFIGRVLDVVENMDPTESFHINIQQGPRADLSMPFPFTIDAHGIVTPQAFWRGDPFLLVGFVADPDTMRIDLHREAFLDEPERAIGMHPIMANVENNYATFRGVVETVHARPVQVTPEKAVYADFAVTTPEGTEAIRIPIGHLLDQVADVDVTAMKAAGWGNTDLVTRMLKWAARAGNSKALDLEEHAFAWDADEMRVEGYIDVEQAEAWLARRSTTSGTATA